MSADTPARSRPSSSPRRRQQPFWLGGAASMGAAVVSHPLDLLKVRLQCSSAGNESIVSMVGKILREDGILSLYNGLSASLLRQATYSTVRFGVYEQLKHTRLSQLQQAATTATTSTSSAAAAAPAIAQQRRIELPTSESIAFSLFSGAIGGVAGNPADVCNVRMQNDKKLPLDQRRNYSSVWDGLVRISREEGVLRLWSGVGPNICRAMLMTAGQLTSYDVFKNTLMRRGWRSENIATHLTASCLAGVVATVITQPVDVVKTRMMNQARTAKVAASSVVVAATAAGIPPPPICSPLAPQPFDSSIKMAAHMLHAEGPFAFFKGFLPALVRLGPHTIATFIFLEQLKRLTMS